MENNMKAQKMSSLINEIRACDRKCYSNRYKEPLRTKHGRVITVTKLNSALPLVDDWRGQPILFISQAPSKQAWADGVLNSEENTFLTDLLLPSLGVSFKDWFSKVFWIHKANCYPYVNKHHKDSLPDMRCSELYLDKIIEAMKPEFILLMGACATGLFNSSIRHIIGSYKGNPSLEEILEWQFENKELLKVKRANNNEVYPALALGHAAKGVTTEANKYAYMRSSEIINVK